MSTQSVSSVAKSNEPKCRAPEVADAKQSGSASGGAASGNASNKDFDNEVLRARARETEAGGEKPTANDNDKAAATSSSSSSSTNDSAEGANGPSGSPSGVDAGIPDAANTLLNPADEIAKLDSDGDRVVMNMTAEGKLQIPLARIPVGAGAKGQYGYDIAVERKGEGGDDKPAPTYDVTFNKRLQGGLTGELAVPGVDPAAELNLGASDSVTMSFDTQEDAARAVSILQRLGASETARDAINAPIPGIGSAGAASNPVPDGDASIADTHSWPTPGNILTAGLRPSGEDMTFLRDNISSYTQEITPQERVKLGAKAANLGIETRLDQNQHVIRTVEVPRNGEPGKLTYTLAGDINSSTKEKLTLGVQQFDQFEVGYIPQNIVDHGELRGEVSLSWDLPAAQSISELAGRPIPELNGLGAPDEISARVDLTYQTQSLLDLSRTDQRHLSLEVSTRNPTEHTGPVVSSLLDGELADAFGAMGDDFTVTSRDEQINRTGSNQQHELGLTVADVGKFGVSLIGNIGRDDIVSRRSRTFTGSEIAQGLNGPDKAAPAPEVKDPAPAEPTPPERFAVIPYEGLNIRSEPSANGDAVTTLRNGTFIDGTGQRRLDGNGDEWVEVQGRGIDGQSATGWVNGRYLQPNAVGAMGPAGRINTDLEAQGYRAVDVQDGDTVWDIAERNGVDPQEAVKLNAGHLVDPNLIFAGDKVYIPGTQAPPAPEPVDPAPPAPDKPETPDSGSSPSEGSSSGGSPAPSSPSGGSPSGMEPRVESGRSADDKGPPPVSGETPDLGAAPPLQPDQSRAELDRILRDYQIAEDPRGTVEWSPGGLAGLLTNEKREITAAEADLMNSLSLFGLKDMRDIKSRAEETSLAQYPIPEQYRNGFPDGRQLNSDFEMWAQNDGHADAFRHAYWNALMTKNFGADFTERLTSAHEGTADNPADREAMDLYNNEVGRNIAQANPDASEEELIDLVKQAVDGGDMLVIDRDGALAWSDEVAFGDHGEANDSPAAGVRPTPDTADSAS